MTKPSELIDEMVKLYLAPTLKEHGFKKKAFSFSRNNGELVEVISVQKSQWNDSYSAKFCINLGVHWPVVHQHLGRPAFNPPPKENDCSLRVRLGKLFDEGNDYWWEVSTKTNLEALGADAVRKANEFGIPWLNRACSLEEAATLAHPSERIVFHVLRGERDIAADLLRKALGESKHATGHFKRLANSLGLPIPP